MVMLDQTPFGVPNRGSHRMPPNKIAADARQALLRRPSGSHKRAAFIRGSSHYRTESRDSGEIRVAYTLSAEGCPGGNAVVAGQRPLRHTGDTAAPSWRVCSGVDVLARCQEDREEVVPRHGPKALPRVRQRGQH